MPLTSSHWGAFHAEWDGTKITPVKPFEADPNPSPIIGGMPEFYDAPSRVRRPAVRKSWLEQGPGANREQRGVEPFVEVSWDTALDLVAKELSRVREEAGNEAIFAGSYGWASAGRLHHAKSQLKRFMNMFGGCVDQVNNYSYGAAMVLLPHVLGDNDLLMGRATSWRSIAENTELFVAFGGVPGKNAQVESGGAGQHKLELWTGRAAANGMRVVNISPIKADTPDNQKAEWLSARPGTDTAIMLAMAHVLITEDLCDRDFLDRYTVGFETFEHYVMTGRDGGFSPEWAERISELPAETIRALARDMASKRTMLCLSWSIQRADHGEQPYWASVALASMLGQIGLPGGGLGFGYGATDAVGGVVQKFKTPQVGAPKNPTGKSIPVARVVDYLLNPGSEIPYNGTMIPVGETKLVYWAGGNPFHHHQDINRLVKAWQQPETIVVHEISWTSTARFADLVLPTTSTLERNDIAVSSGDQYIIAMRQVAPAYAQARGDQAIFAALADRLGFADDFTEGRGEMQWLEHIYEEAREGNKARGVDTPPFDVFWQAGEFVLPENDPPFVAYQAFRTDPVRYPLKTPSGRIEIASETIASFGLADCPGHPTWIEPREWLGSPLTAKYPLHLISNQPKTRLHSQLDAVGESRKSKVRGREPLTMHPADAAARGLADHDIVRVYNDRGSCLAGVLTSDIVRPGVVQLATGAWYDPADPTRPGTMDVHGNPNMLTHDLGTSALSGGPSAQTILVEIEKYEGTLPEVTVRRPPVLL